METCQNCGTQFDVSDAREEYEAEDEFNNGLNYDDQFPGHEFCAACAIAHSLEALSAGLEMDFSLTTGMPPEDMPDDWEMHSSDDYL